jgi:hypothetical protein
MMIVRQTSIRGVPDVPGEYRDYVLGTGTLHHVWELIDRAFRLGGVLRAGRRGGRRRPGVRSPRRSCGDRCGPVPCVQRPRVGASRGPRRLPLRHAPSGRPNPCLLRRLQPCQRERCPSDAHCR